jgi:5-methylcytosine-specific restriction endonuclease McrA
MPDFNPGQELRDFLTELNPIGTNTFLEKMDNDLMSDGKLVNTFYSSCINYLVRRLITTAEFYRRKYPSEWKLRLRKFLRDYTRYRDRHIDTLILLLSKCLSARDASPADVDKRRLRREAQRHGYNCYICGEEMDYVDSEIWNYATVDHMWPTALGGLSDFDNLMLGCKRCNNEHKQDYLDASDYHYEEMSLVSDQGDDNFSSEMKRKYRVAINAKTEWSCTVCGQPAYRVGTLELGRIEPEDSWHFLNVEPYCARHSPKD